MVALKLRDITLENLKRMKTLLKVVTSRHCDLCTSVPRWHNSLAAARADKWIMCMSSVSGYLLYIPLLAISYVRAS